MTNTNIFKENFPIYTERGYSVIPLEYAQKFPTLSGWSKFCTEIMTPETAQTFFGKNRNIGLALGPASGVCAVDIDTDDTALLQQIERLLPESPVKKRGAKGYTAFYKYNGLPSKSVKNDDGTAGIDFLSLGKQTVLPPSVHPNGMEYVWLTPETLLTIQKDKLPELTESQLTALWSLFQNKKHDDHTTPPADISIANIETALDYINPDANYDDWLHVGMALHKQSNGAKWGLDLFDNWSKHGEKYKEWEPAKKWESFTPDGTITINTLFSLARQNGYVPQSQLLQIKKEREAEKLKRKLLAQRLEKLQTGMLPAPGLVGLITKYIQEVSYKNQPILALSGGIVTAGAVYAKLAQTPSGSRSNVYCFSIGETGSGKDDPRKAIQFLFAHKNLNSDLKMVLSGVPASAPGLLDAIARAGGRYLGLIDEIGHYIGAINGKSSPSYSKEIIPMLTQLYSSATIPFKGREYSQRHKDAKPRLDIPQPCVCVLGSSVPSRIYGSVNKEDILDGFMTRWYILETTDINPADNENLVKFEQSSGIALINTINAITIALNRKKVVEEPYTVEQTDDATELLKKYKNEFNNIRIKCIEQHSDEAYLYTRTYENLVKLALVGSEINPETNLPFITANSVEWAYKVVLFSVERMKVLLEEIEKSGYGKQWEDMEMKIKSKNKPLTLSEFGTMFRNIPCRDRNGLLEDLISAGHIIRNKTNGITYIEHVDNVFKL